MTVTTKYTIQPKGFISVALKRAFALVLLGLAGCTYQHSMQTVTSVGKNLGFSPQVSVARGYRWVLPSSSSVYFTYPEVGVRVPHDAARLRHDFSTALEQAFTHKFQRVKMADMDTSLADVFTRAQEEGFNVVFCFTVQSVEDRLSSLTEWHQDYGLATRNPIPRGADHVEVALSAYDVQTQRKLDTWVVSSRTARWAWDAQTPHDLVAEVSHQLQTAAALDSVPFN